jgi:predicted MPP superfamily phosphohydrolase
MRILCRGRQQIKPNGRWRRSQKKVILLGPALMKILITADLHYREHWFRWLIEQSPDYDLICVAGDLLDMFKGEPRIEQAREVSRWIHELTTITRVAVCSGNHDNAGRQLTADRAPDYEWFLGLRSSPKITTDRVTRVIDDLIVTTVPYHCSREPSFDPSLYT